MATSQKRTTIVVNDASKLWDKTLSKYKEGHTKPPPPYPSNPVLKSENIIQAPNVPHNSSEFSQFQFVNSFPNNSNYSGTSQITNYTTPSYGNTIRTHSTYQNLSDSQILQFQPLNSTYPQNQGSYFLFLVPNNYFIFLFLVPNRLLLIA